jgi:hypothetical protein
MAVTVGDSSWGNDRHSASRSLHCKVYMAAITAAQFYTAAMVRPFQNVLLKGVLADMECAQRCL